MRRSVQGAPQEAPGPESRCPPLFPQPFLYLAWYTAVSVLGHYNDFFFAAHLLDIAMGFKTLRTILSSVTHNGKQVLGVPLVQHRRDPGMGRKVVTDTGRTTSV